MNPIKKLTGNDLQNTVEAVVERRIVYEYGPPLITGELRFKSEIAGEYTWDQLHEKIKDERWGGSYAVIKCEERIVSYTEWRELESD